MTNWVGIDFSGNAAMWAANIESSNVWIAQLTGSAARPTVAALDRVQKLPGGGHPFHRLVSWLRERSPLAIGIDAPFSIPQRHLPSEGGRDALLDAIRHMPHEGRPFPRGCHLVDYARQVNQLQQAQPLRETERRWRAKGINVRSTLWNGRARPGAPFTVACLRLIAETGFPCWPWQEDGRPLLVEAFPAGQLRHWQIKTSNDQGPELRREAVLQGLTDRVCVPERHWQQACANPDALDAILCAFAAIAVTERQIGCAPPDNTADEGWIAVHC